MNENLRMLLLAGVIIISVAAVYFVGFFVPARTSSLTQSSTISTTAASTSSAVSSQTATRIMTTTTGSLVLAAYGMVASSGVGTQALEVSFVANSSTFSSQVAGGRYNVSLPGPGLYGIDVTWSGNYSWQSGVSVATPPTVQIRAGQGPLRLDIAVATPDSTVAVGGTVSTTGLGTKATGVVFDYGGLVVNTSVTAGRYSIRLPNLAEYSTMVSWTGSYPWQKGESNATLTQVILGPGTTGQESNIQSDTPDSLVVVSGAIASPQGTTPTLIIFTGGGLLFTATPRNGAYSLQLANLEDYLVSIRWANGTGSGTCTPLPDSMGVYFSAGVSSQSGVDWSC